jgi:hypothetical protein
VTTKIAFFPHNQPHTKFFTNIASLLRKEDDIESVFIKEVGLVEGQSVFQFELELERIWHGINISNEALKKLQS